MGGFRNVEVEEEDGELELSGRCHFGLVNQI
jgi:hypothetical protein